MKRLASRRQLRYSITHVAAERDGRGRTNRGREREGSGAVSARDAPYLDRAHTAASAAGPGQPRAGNCD